MAELIQITDYSIEAFELLIEQYKNSKNLKAILAASTKQADDLETAIFEVRDLIYLETAEGAQLDIIGSIWGQDREGRSDEEYRSLIQLRISLSISGTITEIYDVLKLFYNATYVEYQPVYPAKFLLLTDATIPSNDLNEISPAGVATLIRPRDFIDRPSFGFRSTIIDNNWAVTKDLYFLEKHS